MTGLAQAAAQQEVETAQAASAAVVAEAAAEVTVLAAASLVQQATENAAAEVAEVVEAVEETERDLSWLTKRMEKLETELRNQQETQRLTLEQLQSAVFQLSNPAPVTPEETAPPNLESSVAVVDPLAVVINPSPPVVEKKRHRLL